MEHEQYPQKPLEYDRVPIEEVGRRAKALRQQMDARRSVRDISSDPVPREVLENIMAVAASAPSGANKQPWTFCAVSDPGLKRQMRIAAEEEERANYEHRMNKEWLADLMPIASDWHKPFVETAPWIIVVFRRAWNILEDGERGQTYYSQESVGIATGFLLSAIHQCGLVALTHTPSPMAFLQELLRRPSNERAYMLIPMGYPTEQAMVPDIMRYDIEKAAAFYETENTGNTD